MIRRSLKDLPRALSADRAGATSIEYALIGSLIALVIIAGMATLSPELSGAFERTANLFPS